MQAVLSKMAKGISVCYSEVFPNANDDYFHVQTDEGKSKWNSKLSSLKLIIFGK